MTTNYTTIAPVYDNNPIRNKDVDTEIAVILAAGKDDVKILDLACGTGNYLKTQSEYYHDTNVKWTGMDKSKEMLKYARAKNSNVEFIWASAENICNYESEFDYIRNEFSFHHFTDKAAAARNIARMLKPDGLFIMVNICPDYMHNSWVYKYFPSTEKIDQERFIGGEKIYSLFAGNGFDISIDIRVTISKLDYPGIIAEAINRDMSQLNLISDREYHKGLEKLKSDYTNLNDNIFDFALLECRGIRKS